MNSCYIALHITTRMRINIAKHVFTYLVENQRVSLPQIGTFKLKHIATSFSENRRSLLPPTIEIEYFNDKNDSDSLANFIASEEGIPLGKAEQFVQIFVNQIQSKISQDNAADIGYIGSLSINTQKAIHFEPYSDIQEHFLKGLPEIVLPDLVKGARQHKPIVVDQTAQQSTAETGIAKDTAKLDSKEAIKLETKATTVNQNVQTTSNTIIEQETVPEKGCFSKWGIPLISLLVLGLLITMLYKKCAPSNATVKETITEATTDKNTTAATVDTSETDIDSITEEAETTAVPHYSSEEDPSNETKGSDNCIIILGAYTNFENSTELRRKINDRGFKHHHSRYGAFHRIGFEFECDGKSDKQLMEYLSSIQKEFKKGDAWYLEPEMY